MKASVNKGEGVKELCEKKKGYVGVFFGASKIDTRVRRNVAVFCCTLLVVFLNENWLENQRSRK